MKSYLKIKSIIVIILIMFVGFTSVYAQNKDEFRTQPNNAFREGEKLTLMLNTVL